VAIVEPYILFELAGTAYGIRSQVVQRLEMVEQITPVPNAPRYVDGVVFSRGRVVPAVNLRLRFGLTPAPYDAKTRLIVVAHQERVIGLIVDSAREFIPIPDSAIQPLPESLMVTSGEYLAGIARVNEKVILLLEVGEVIREATSAPPATVRDNTV
jgi:purine-binding chemotaxis protein CheW